MRKTAVCAALLLSAVLSLTACANSEQAAAPATHSTAAGAPRATASATSKASTASGPACTPDQVGVTGTFGVKPTITIPDGCTPSPELVAKDLVAGTGPETKAGDTVAVNYQLVSWSDRQAVDSSFDRGQPLSLRDIGNAGVIAGWNEGLIGLKQGARRLLIVPPAKGYGAQGKGSIKGGETLVFVIDGVKIGA